MKDFREKMEQKVEGGGMRSRPEPSLANLLLNHLDTAAFCLNAEARFLHVNHAFCRLMGRSAQDLQAVSLYDLEPDGSISIWQEQWQMLKETRSLTKPAQYQIQSGNSLSVIVNMTYVEHQGQEVICAFVKASSRANQEITAFTNSVSIELSKSLGEFKSQFISVICHQLRSLLNIISFSNSLLKRHLSQWTVAESQPYLEHIQTSVDQITQLLDKSLLFGKSVTGAIITEPVSLNLNVFCQELIHQMQPMLKANQQEIAFVGAEERSIIADPNLLHILLMNLLANASKSAFLK
jgi:PAS domain S-box-containing protein